PGNYELFPLMGKTNLKTGPITGGLTKTRQSSPLENVENTTSCEVSILSEKCLPHSPQGQQPQQPFYQ
ncbi:MAG: hypothetical protein K2Y08_07140, partial [Alphaproteobacteria bacterium]|nr:hypothetical protein [Alphaproteobacteria bacterium]